MNRIVGTRPINYFFFSNRMLSIVYYVYSHPPPNEPPMILSVDPILQLPNFIDSFFCIVSIVENKWGEHRFLSS